MGKLYACSDIHGKYELWKKIKAKIHDDDWLYFLGDAADRGPDGYRIIKELLEMPNVTYLMGNHEDFFIKGAWKWFDSKSEYITWTILNGGQVTFTDWLADSKEEQARVLFALEELPEMMTIFNHNHQKIYLSHAGFTPENNKIEDTDYYLWNRSHFVRPWPKDEDNTYIIHGHTPTPFLIETLKSCDLPYEIIHGAVKYANGHKINIDLGCFASHKTCLLDLDTFEIIPIESEIYPMQDFWD